jgi:hypothetical protein
MEEEHTMAEVPDRVKPFTSWQGSEREEENRVPKSPSRTCPNNLKTFCQSSPLKSCTTFQ